MKVKFNLDDDLRLNKTLQIYNMVLVVLFIFMKATNITRKFF